MTEPNQIEYAERVAEALNLCDDYEITAPDLLDALATTGLKLVQDEGGDATVAYQSKFMREDN